MVLQFLETFISVHKYSLFWYIKWYHAQLDETNNLEWALKNGVGR